MRKQILWDQGTEHDFKSKEFVSVISMNCYKYLWQKN